MSALTKKDFQTENDVRWCPGCGDYVILAAVQKALAEMGVERDNTVFVSGIGCAARFPYYMNSYGLHTIHGRAPAVATGLKATRPDLSVWVITGDGDSLSIGGNHTLHMLRRNLDVNVLMFNNQVYGLTKGQYSPTSPQGMVAKSTPFGSVDQPVNPMAFALGAGASFVARTTDSDPQHLAEVIKKAHAHRGTSYVEIYQNCVVFNDNAFTVLNDKSKKQSHRLLLEDGKPLLFNNGSSGIGINKESLRPMVIDLVAEPERLSEVLIHREADDFGTLAHVYSTMTQPEFPIPLGVLRAVVRPTFEEDIARQNEFVEQKYGKGTLDQLFYEGDTWEVV